MNLANELEPPVPPEEIAAADAAKPEVETPKVEAPKAEDKPEEKQEQKEEVQPEKLVRLEALHEERQKRKELAKQLEQMKREQAQKEAILNERLSQLYAASQPKPQEPDPNDPLAVHEHKLKENERALAELRQRQQREDYQRHQAAQTQQLVSWARGQAMEYAKENPDFEGAYTHVRTMRVKELEAMGLEPDAIAQTLTNDELWIFNHAYQVGKNPAEILHAMAKNTGFKKEPVIPPEQKLEMKNKGLEASKTVSGGGGGGAPTPEQIAAMSDEEFAEFKAKLGKKGQRISDAL